MTYNNPARHNAMSYDMQIAVPRILGAFASDPDVHVIVVQGAGDRAFVSGADISEFSEKRTTVAARADYDEALAAAWRSWRTVDKPIIAMIRGYCIGGGLGVALGCDLRICADNARFALPAAKLGLGYGFPGIKRFCDTVGPSFTKEFFFTARQFDANEALAMGLANRVLPAAELESYVKKYAEMISANAPLTIEGTKFIVGEVLKDPAERNLKACEEKVMRCFNSTDYQEGRKAFMEKRKPVFTGS
jgi:enoyl-CoA hydratase/carnithine racemase